MAFTTSINIERDFGTVPDYIVTANARQTIGKIISQFNSGIHSFCLVGSYGTGKSSFIIALENSLLGLVSHENALVKEPKLFNGFKKFEFLNIVGDYQSLSTILSSHLNSQDANVLTALDKYYQAAQRKNAFLVIVIDEFGKILEYAAKNNPEKEMYFLQKFCEYINSPRRNLLFLSTLHQGFGAYAKDLKPEQKQEWLKVKGRIQDIVFSEPIEQLLNLTATRLSGKAMPIGYAANEIYRIGQDAKIIGQNLDVGVSTKLYPLDIIAAYVLTLSNQRYGQNERTLFTFLETTGGGSIAEFVPEEKLMYNLSNVYDYIAYNFYSRLQEINEDSAQWSAIKIAIERVESLQLEEDQINDAIKIVKAVGLLNIFAPVGARVDMDTLASYATNSMAIENVKDVIRQLEKANILRFAKYKMRYILFEGTDINIEAGLYEASRVCKPIANIAEAISGYFDFKLSLANASYFQTGTPRYFQHSITSAPIDQVPKGLIDGYINILFPATEDVEAVRVQCLQNSRQAIVYCLFTNIDRISRHLHEIDKLKWVREIYIADENDKVANREVSKLMSHEQSLLNKSVWDDLFGNNVEWYACGQRLETVKNQRDLNRQLSKVCQSIYPSTPTYHFELINKSKPNGVMSLARKYYLDALLANSDEPDLGFPKDKFPPEKSIFLTLLKNTGIYSSAGNLEQPTEESFQPLWQACEEFLAFSASKNRKVSELYSILLESPFRLKQGFLDCWIPTFLIIKKDDYALYSEDRYIPYINQETIELLLRNPCDFSVKAFSVDGVKMGFFEKYREAINLDKTEINTGSFIETIRPFLTFYRKLNNYARRTKDISANARKFRDVIANATDPERTFFETLPEQLGFKEIVINQNPEAIGSFVDVIHDAIRDLRSCYNELVDTIEKNILTSLHIDSKRFTEYYPAIAERFQSVRTELMPMKLKNFYGRLMGTYNNRVEWIEAICYVPLNKPLADIRDAEKEYLLSSLWDMLFQLDDYVEMHKSSIDNVVRLHITQNKADGLTKQVVIPTEMVSEVNDIESKIEALLSGDTSVDVAALINVLKKKLK